MYVTGGGDSEEITVTSTSDEFCSWSSVLLGLAVLTYELCSSWSVRSGWTTAIGCAVFLVSGVPKQAKTLKSVMELFKNSKTQRIVQNAVGPTIVIIIHCSHYLCSHWLKAYS